MLLLILARDLGRAARAFVNDSRGNIAVFFALASLPILASVGAAIDYSRANSGRTTLQAALDSTALMVSKDLSSGKINAADVSTTAQTYFVGLHTKCPASPSGTTQCAKDAPASMTATYAPPTAGKDATVTIAGSGSINTDFMKIMGFRTMTFTASSTST